MEIQTDYLQKFHLRPVKSPAQEDYFRRQELADSISKWSNGELPIPMLMRFQKQKGERFVRSVWEAARQPHVREPIKLFKHLYGKQKVELKESK